jgi:hypothetical protein
VLAILAIVAALIFFVFNDPPHTVCDVQKDNLREDLKGQVFSTTTLDKHTLPPILGRAQEGCQQGNSAGSCYEYFTILRKIARNIQNYSSECRTDLSSIPEIQKAMRDGVILMAKMSWGSHPPEPGMARVGWLQESELSLFCQLKNVFSLSFGDEAWSELRLKIYGELPGDAPSTADLANPQAAEPPKAVATMSEKDIWARSIFSIRCENYR